MWAAFHGAWEVLAFRARVANLVVEADAGTATRFAVTTPRAVLAKAGTITLLALVAPRAMLAEAGTATRLTLVAPRAVLAEAGAAAIPALVALPFMRTLLPNPPLDWMRRRGVRRCCRSCWGYQIHGSEL